MVMHQPVHDVSQSNPTHDQSVRSMSLSAIMVECEWFTIIALLRSKHGLPDFVQV